MTSGTVAVSGRKDRPRSGGAWEEVAGTPLCNTARMSCKVDCMELTLFSSCSIRLHLGRNLVSHYLQGRSIPCWLTLSMHFDRDTSRSWTPKMTVLLLEPVMSRLCHPSFSLGHLTSSVSVDQRYSLPQNERIVCKEDRPH
jgi:hypothetical protein